MSPVVVTGAVLVGSAVVAVMPPITPAPARVVAAPAAPPRSRSATRAMGAVIAGVSVALAVAVGGVGLVVIGVVGGLLTRVVVLGRARRRRVAEQDRAFPDLVDLFRIAVAAGHPVPRCVELVADRAPSSHRPALDAARARMASGRPLTESLGSGTDLGSLGPTLVEALASGHITGSPLGPPLDRLAAAARHRRARAAEAQARRLPVTMLFPLVGCILPAFVLLAVVPLLVASFGSLPR